MPEKTIHYIPATKKLNKEMRVAIYARVSSSSADQLRSLSVQVSSLAKFVASYYGQGWLISNVYIDVHTSKTGTQREQLARLIDDARAGLIDILVVSNVSRLGRDSVQVLESIQILNACDVRIIFKDDNLDTLIDDHTLIIQITEAIAQAENESRGDAIKWGHRKRAETGMSKLYDRPAFGYEKDPDGNLIIHERNADVVRQLFRLYLSGKSLLGIVKEFEIQGIKSPEGNDKWSRGTIDKMLRNEKYTGKVILLKSDDSTPSYQYEDHHESIISDAMFDAVQLERERRSNVDAHGKRKSTKYSSKKTKDKAEA